MPVCFDHEKLRVYQQSIRFVAWASDLLAGLPNKGAVKDQLDRASTSVPLNIAEGNGKDSFKDRTRFLEFARGSALECAACLDVMVAKGMIDEAAASEGKTILVEVVSMLMGLLNRFSGRMMEEAASYGGEEQDYE